MINIAYLGIPGSYSFIAGKVYFAGNNMMKGCNNIKQIFESVAGNICQAGIIPLENSTTGSINESYDKLLENDLYINGEIIIHIHHNLLVKKSTEKITNIVSCLSHQQAINQCDAFFDKFKWIKPKFVSDTATAAETISESKKENCAAIASLECAKIYKLKVLRQRIEDNPANFTRFVIIEKVMKNPGNKASLVFSVVHKPGSLLKTLKPYAKYGLNLTKIESRPIFGKPWEYVFLLDLEFGDRKKDLDRALEEMKKNVNFIKLLGVYPKGKVYES